VVAGGAGGARPPADADEERTSIDPPAPGVAWEDGSTTVEEAAAGEAGRRNGTTTGTGDVPTSTGTGEEPTVEDPARSSHPLVLVPSAATAAKAQKPRGAPAAARLVAVAGNDTGRHFALDTSRVMSIGRAVDNEVVLTDIAVSRRHLELAHDGQQWILRDRGSGNGTVVNDRIEDGSYTLRHGDRIEIGNTILRFELPTPPPAGASWGVRDDEEASTVAGRQPPRASFEPAATAPVAKVPPSRAAPGSARRSAPTTAPQRPSQLPADRARSEPSIGRGDPSGSQRHGPLTAPPAAAAPDSGPLLQGLVPPAGPAAIAAASAETGPGPGRQFTTTALVEPFPRPATILPYSFGIGPISRTKLLVGSLLGAAAIGLIGVVAALTTTETPVGASVAAASALPPSTWGTDEAALRATRPNGGRVLEVDDLDRIEIGDDDLDALSGADPAAVPTAAKPREPAVELPAPPAPEPLPDETAEERAAVEKAAAALADADRLAEKAAAERAALAFVPPVILPPAPEKPAPEKPAPEKPAPVARPAPAPKPAIARPAPRPAPAPKPAPPPKPRKQVAAAAATRAEEPRAPRSAAAARKKAQTQYAAKDFRGAAVTLRVAAGEADDDEAAELRDIAGDYEAVGAGLNAGNAALTSNPAEATSAFQKAYQADRRVGAVHTDYLRAKLAQSSPKAAASFMARGNLEAAKKAVDTAVSVGAGASPTVQQVRQSLERKAGELYASGMKMLSSEPEDARALLRRVLKIVDASSPWYGKAYKVVGK
jgi:hypothetical protein